MPFDLPLARYAHAVGGWRAAWRFAGADLRKAAGLATASASWDMVRRDAAHSMVGREHASAGEGEGLFVTSDLRRDPVLLWLAGHGSPLIAEAAGVLARSVAAKQGFTDSDATQIDVAMHVVTQPPTPNGPVARFLAATWPIDDPMLAPLVSLAAMVDRLRRNPAFLERGGDQVRHQFADRALTYYVPAEAGAAWALNLALSARWSAFDGLVPTGLISRALFQAAAEPDEIALALLDGATRAMEASYDRLDGLERERLRGQAALGRLSRNARAFDAWLLVTTGRVMRRTQLARALGLSRSGADIQAHVLAQAGLVTLAPGGLIHWARPSAKRPPTDVLERGPIGGAVAALDASMAEIDRLLARSGTEQPGGRRT